MEKTCPFIYGNGKWNDKQLDYFYNFGNVGSNQVDNLVGSFEYKGSVAPDINFTSQNYLTSFRDTGIELYSMTQVPEVSLTADFTDKVKA